MAGAAPTKSDDAAASRRPLITCRGQGNPSASVPYVVGTRSHGKPIIQDPQPAS